LSLCDSQQVCSPSSKSRKQSVIPQRLYKYRAFDARAVELLVDDKVYFANPADFNDPLDTRPSLEADLDVPDLEELLEALTTRRISAEMQAAALSIRYKGPKTMEHIERHTRREAERLLKHIAYMATDPEYEESPPGPQVRLLRHYIEQELLRQYDRGVLSLASRYECPLMWSHYGDQHKGLCIGYSIPEGAAAKNLHEVHYGGSRLVKASHVKSMLEGDVAARQLVDRGVLLRKAADWQYEKEWRIVGARGPADSPLELEEVNFGIRCLPAVRHAVLKALQGREREVKFFQMQEIPGEFGLHRRELDEEDLASKPRRFLSLLEDFEDISGQDVGSEPTHDKGEGAPAS
jgi:hypothetical protein